MADQETIKSFLVDLGFKVKEPELKKFEGAVHKMTKTAEILGAAIAGTATAVAITVARFASKMEDVYYASQRTGTAVKNIYALEYAAKNLGASTADVQGAIESLGQFRFSIPGWERFLQTMGVKTRNAKGQIRDMGDIIVDLGKRMGHMPTYLQMQYSHILGINYKMLRAITNPQFAAQYAQREKIAKASGVNFQQLAKQSHDFEMHLRNLGTDFGALGDIVESQFFNRVAPELDKIMAKLDKWILHEMPKFRKVTGHVLDEVAKDFKTVTKVVKSLIDTMEGIHHRNRQRLIGIGHGLSNLWQHPGISAAHAYSSDWDWLKSLFTSQTSPGAYLNRLFSPEAPALSPAGPAAATAQRWPWEQGAGSATINQKTDIHVHGTGNAIETGKAVGAEQNRVNQRLIRNLKNRAR